MHEALWIPGLDRLLVWLIVADILFLLLPPLDAVVPTLKRLESVLSVQKLVLGRCNILIYLRKRLSVGKGMKGGF